jgi:hypothetical protein
MWRSLVEGDTWFLAANMTLPKHSSKVLRAPERSFTVLGRTTRTGPHPSATPLGSSLRVQQRDARDPSRRRPIQRSPGGSWHGRSAPFNEPDLSSDRRECVVNPLPRHHKPNETKGDAK